MTAQRTVAGGSRDQVARLLTLVPYLHAHGQVELEEAARLLDVSGQQVVKDLKVLLMCGLPGGYPDDLIDVDLDALEGDGADGVIRISNADYLARPLRLTATEASAIIMALRALRAGAGDDTDAVDRALAKLEAAAAGGLADIDLGEDSQPVEAPGVRRTLQDAVAQGRQVRLTYYVPSRDHESDRVVDPRGLVTAHGFTYLDAWCHTAEAARLFRLDRVQAAELLDTPVAAPAQEPRDLGDELFSWAADATTATVRLAPAARWVVEYYQVLEVRPLPDGGADVDLLVADERWLERLLLRLAPHAQVVAPRAFAETYSATVVAALALYDGGAAGH